MNSARFDLEKSLSLWRRSVEGSGAFLGDDLDELEQHVRDQTAGLVRRGLSEEEAFSRAMREMGDYGSTEREYGKVYWQKLKRRGKLSHELYWRMVMLHYYARIAYRNLLRHKGYSAINIFGLALGMAVCLLIFLFIDHERSFDAFHAERDRIYRLNEVQSFEGMSPQHVALSMYPMAPALKADFPEVEDYVRFVGADGLLKDGDRQAMIDGAFWVDSTFFEVFDFDLQEGDEATALALPGNAVLTETAARKLFGDEDPMGKTFTSGDVDLKVTGILEDVPPTSHLQFEGAFALRTIENERMLSNWGGNWLNTYLLLEEGTDPAAVDAKFADFEAKYMGDGAEFYTLYLQPLTDVHLGSSHVTHDYNNYRKFDRTYVFTFSILAAFVLAIAAINFMNISAARAAHRTKEVGVRKVVGAQRLELAQQFIGESVLLAFIALVLALGMALAAVPALELLTTRDLSFGFFVQPRVVAVILGTALLVGVLSGAYPALLMSSFKPVTVLRQQSAFSMRKGRRLSLRNGLVVLQFAIAITMIVGTVLTIQQLRFLQTRNPGFDREQVITLPLNRTANEKSDLLRSELLRLPHVKDLTASGQRLGNNIHQTGFRAVTPEGERRFAGSHLNVDFGFIPFYGLELAAGRAFSEERGTDRSRAFVVNEAMVREMGWKDPIGQPFALGFQDSLGTVIGVVKDFNFNSLHHKIQPIALSIQDFGYSEISVRVDGAEMERTLAGMEGVWTRVVGDRPFQYTFLEEHFAELYASDRKVSQVVAILAGLAVFIACLGLFGLSSIAIDQRIKEIGIRKVLGARVSQLVVLLSSSFAVLVAVAFVLATPLAYVLIRQWLEGFAYRIPIHPGVFVLAGVAALGIAILTVSYRAVAAARANPVKALRYE